MNNDARIFIQQKLWIVINVLGQNFYFLIIIKLEGHFVKRKKLLHYVEINIFYIAHILHLVKKHILFAIVTDTVFFSSKAVNIPSFSNLETWPYNFIQSRNIFVHDS